MTSLKSFISKTSIMVEAGISLPSERQNRMGNLYNSKKHFQHTGYPSGVHSLGVDTRFGDTCSSSSPSSPRASSLAALPAIPLDQQDGRGPVASPAAGLEARLMCLVTLYVRGHTQMQGDGSA